LSSSDKLIGDRNAIAKTCLACTQSRNRAYGGLAYK